MIYDLLSLYPLYAPCGICIGLLLTFASNGPQLRALRMFRELCVILTVGLQSFQIQKYRINKIVNLFQFYVQKLGCHQSQHFCCVWSGKISCKNPCLGTIIKCSTFTKENMAFFCIFHFFINNLNFLLRKLYEKIW